MLIALGLAAALTASDPDGVVTTAPVGAGSVIADADAPVSTASPAPQTITPHNLTTQQQIDRWLAARPEAEPFANDALDDDRKVHGYVSGSIGSNDFSAVDVGVSIPLGQRGRMDLSYQQVRNGYGLYGFGPRRLGPYGYGYGYGRGYDYAYGPLFGAEANPWSSAGASPDADVLDAPFDLPRYREADRPFGRRDPRAALTRPQSERPERP